MAIINLTINGRSYEMSCDDGQEPHLRKLAEYIDEKVRQLAESVGPVGDSRLLVMANLLIADELFDAYTKMHAQAQEGAQSEDTAVAVSAARALDACAARIEAIADRVARPH